MPMYTWEDQRSKRIVDVIRSFAEYEVPPTKEEVPDLEDPEWVRQIGSQINVTKGNGWGSGKGYWARNSGE